MTDWIDDLKKSVEKARTEEIREKGIRLSKNKVRTADYRLYVGCQPSNLL